MSENNKTTDEGGDDQTSTIEALRAELAAEKAEKEKVDAKNKELVREKQATKDAADKAARANESELEKALRERDELRTQLETTTNDFTNLQANWRAEKAETTLAKAFTANNVDNSDFDVLTRAYRGEIKFSDDGKALVGDKEADAFFKSYFANAGKKYVRASENSGGGAQGGTSTAAPTMNATNWDNTKFMELATTNPGEAKAMALAAGKTTLANSIEV